MRNPEPIFNIRADHGEGPVWDPQKRQLYWVDIMVGKYYKADYPSGDIEEHSIGQELGVLALRETGGIVMGVRDGFGFYEEETRTFRLLEDSPEKNNKKVRFNDGAVDPAGRFFAGTMEWEGKEDIGALYLLDMDHSHRLMEENIFITNGMGWSPDKKKYYMTDTFRNVIYVYDYDLSTGNISNRKNHITFDSNVYPDGMTIDSDGGFWVAIWGGAKIVRFDASGKKMEEILLPVLHPTSCCFGGDEMKTLFITTSRHPLSEAQRKEYPMAGRMFAMETDTRGMVEPRYRG